MHPSGEVRTYREIDEASIRLAQVLRERGLGPGDHVAVLLDNQPEFYDVVWAAHAHRLLRHADQLAPHRRRGRLHRRATATPPRCSPPPGSADVVDGDGRRPRRRHHPHLASTATCPASSATRTLVAGVDAGDLAGPARGRLDVLLARAPPGKPKGILPPLLDADLGAKSFLTHAARRAVRLHQRRRCT